jgi:hypothetical protein
MNTTAIDFRTLPQNVPTICIPRVFPNINESRIRKVFDDLKMGQIERVDIVSKTTEKGEKFNRVFVHFKKWNSEGNAQVARERLLNGKDIKIVYDDPWFWKVSAYRQPEREHQQKPRAQQKPAYKKPTIEFDDSDEERKPTSSRPVNMKFRKADMDTKKQKQEVQVPRRASSPTRINTNPRINAPPSSPSPSPSPRSPSSSPPRRVEIQEEDDTQPPIPKLDYGKITMPKKRNVVKKPVVVASKPEIKIEEVKEMGEV